MKRLFTLLMAAAGFVACTHGSFEEQIEHPGGFTATIEGIDTKTSMDGPKVLWSSGDQVSVFAGMNINELYQVSKASAGKASASFNKVGSSEGFGSAIPTNVAFYPYSSDVELDWSGKASVYATIPATQTYAEGSFGQGDFPMMAVTQDTADKDFAFKNVCGVLKLQLTGSQTVRSIEFKGNDGEVISGDAVITSNHSGFPSIQMTGNGATVTLDCGEGVQLGSVPREFFIVLPPVTFSKGFTVTVTDTDGKTMEIATDKSQTISRSHILKMPEKEYNGETTVDEPAGELCFTAMEASTIRFVHSGSSTKVKLEYLLGESKWSPYTIGDTISLETGESVYFRACEGGNSTFSADVNKYYYFDMTGKVNASGNIMSLLDPAMELDVVPDGAFVNLFHQCTSLLSAPELPADAVGECSYESMFSYCTNLIAAPELPATILGPYCYEFMFSHCGKLKSAPQLQAKNLADHCYSCMFQDCNALTEAPELPATVLAPYCYLQLFYGCSSLKTSPSLPATTLAEGCYQNMFWHCSSLIAAPELPVTTLAEGCYNSMFNGCSSLTEAPELPATELAVSCYTGMFYGCTKLTKSPRLQATTLAEYCYDLMFTECTALTEAPELPATTLKGHCYERMFEKCTALTKAPELPATTLATYCYQCMFSNCTSLTEAPELPASTLKSHCYEGMFEECTALTEAPELSATTLSRDCYNRMFYNCSSLSMVKCYAIDMSAATATEDWLYGVSPTGTFYADPSADWNEGVSGIPEGWVVKTL